MTDWIAGNTPPEPGQYLVHVGGSARIATWNDRDRRYYDGYTFIQPRDVRGYARITPFPNDEETTL
jgi:hypothetical protein